MPKHILFWGILILSLIFGAWWSWPNWRPWVGYSLVPLILIVLLGWQVFGPPIR